MLNFKKNFSLLCFTMLYLLCCCSCSAAKSLYNHRNPDLSELRTGLERSKAEKYLGKPVREEKIEPDFVKCYYKYVRGADANIGTAFVEGAYTIGTFGLWELIAPSIDKEEIYGLAITYNMAGKIYDLEKLTGQAVLNIERQNKKIK